MRVINFRYSKFSIGKSVVIIKEYKSGMIHLRIGEVGIIDDITIENLPDFGLFDLRIVHFKFGPFGFGLSDKIAQEYMDRL